jgi:hypothetical protein
MYNKPDFLLRKKALEWYIYCPPPPDGSLRGSNDRAVEKTKKSTSLSKPSLTLHQLLQHLSLPCIIKDDQTLMAALEKASQMCTAHLESASSLISDASENAVINYEAYTIHLMAHSLAAQGTLKWGEKYKSSTCCMVKERH